jgi:hypothetical protein
MCQSRHHKTEEAPSEESAPPARDEHACAHVVLDEASDGLEEVPYSA